MNHDDNNDALWAAISRIEISVKNSQNHIKRLFLHSTRQEIAIEGLDKKVDLLDERVGSLDKRVELLDKKVDSLDKRVDSLDKRVDSLDKRVDSLDKKVDLYQRENRERFDKIEDTLAIIVNHLKN